ncbi:hypothetical protein CLU83_2310 [Flavobacterium sp. 1]|uniref:DUF6565 domain-containing protein n=1 Tax=Flavobacterium sp. 1 TaxID=2035200 RepID=UPI000C24254C|nr:DUF6565 domain-containing protein [Flavobacterium sp. 1]PJJ08996.1 hypothetical protein CLU83_2310 [Flavobacterium sp. 1]
MKNLKLTFAIVATVIAFASCKDEKQEKAQKSLDAYSSYVDSLNNVQQEKAIDNWAIIESDYARLKSEAEISLEAATDKTKLQDSLKTASLRYEEFKTNILSEKEKLDKNNSEDENNTKTVIYKTLFGPNYVNDDMKFNWVNKDNILSVYDNFVSTVKKNKDSYSREDWDEIKIVYEALDSRKNTVEKEGLTSHDNNKIAGLKLKFAPMYTLNRMGAKSDENAEAKK